MDEEGEKWEVEKILDHEKRGRKWFFLIKWKSYNEDKNTWEPVGNLDNCKTILKDYQILHKLN